jgi:hypothetical protein
MDDKTVAKFDFASLERPFEADWPVTVQEPKDGGYTTPKELSVRFRTLTDVDKDAIAALKAAGGDGAREELRLAIVGFGKDETVEWSDDMFELLMGRSYVAMALFRAKAQFEMGSAVKN